jgi:hypothetical protein
MHHYSALKVPTGTPLPLDLYYYLPPDHLLISSVPLNGGAQPTQPQDRPNLTGAAALTRGTSIRMVRHDVANVNPVMQRKDPFLQYLNSSFH